MKHAPECIPCLMGRVLFQSRLPNNGKEEASCEAALKKFAETISVEPNSARLATLVHRSSYDALGVSDPYRDLKVRADIAAMKYDSRVREYIQNSDDIFKAAVKVAILGNIMDFGAGIAIESPEEFDSVFESLLKMELAIDDTGMMKEIINSKGTVVYIFDNCGETVFDIPLIQQIRAMGCRVVGVVRGEPILNDVTLEDAQRIGLEDQLDRLLTTGAFAIGVDMRKIGGETKKELEAASMIIAKGMANFESLGEERLQPTAFLLKAKCTPVAAEIGTQVGSNVAKMVIRT
ncbi:damage-control phosphatase ARMT1 family protein [Candidatus Methanoplasma termitum]|nr:ARMT1-like domain-containing protein [Candidatus Methanoplasma termitum]